MGARDLGCLRGHPLSLSIALHGYVTVSVRSIPMWQHHYLTMLQSDVEEEERDGDGGMDERRFKVLHSDWPIARSHFPPSIVRYR